MKHSTFILNRRFLINPALNQVKDLELGEEARLESRLVSLISLLTAHNGQLVSREMIIREIWNDYGGAEDGLNQAISLLRKVFRDSKKELIETVPKKGYVLHAEVSNCLPGEAATGPKPGRLIKLRRLVGYGIAVAVVVPIIAALLFWSGETERSTIRSGKPVAQSGGEMQHKAVESSFSSIDIPEHETFLNTISTTAPDGTRYRLTAIGDRRPEFYIDNRLASDAEKDANLDLMAKLMRQLWQRQKAYHDSMQADANK